MDVSVFNRTTSKAHNFRNLVMWTTQVLLNWLERAKTSAGPIMANVLTINARPIRILLSFYGYKTFSVNDRVLTLPSTVKETCQGCHLYLCEQLMELS